MTDVVKFKQELKNLMAKYNITLEMEVIRDYNLEVQSFCLNCYDDKIRTSIAEKRRDQQEEILTIATIKREDIND